MTIHHELQGFLKGDPIHLLEAGLPDPVHSHLLVPTRRHRAIFASTSRLGKFPCMTSILFKELQGPGGGKAPATCHPAGFTPTRSQAFRISPIATMQSSHTGGQVLIP